MTGDPLDAVFVRADGGSGTGGPGGGPAFPLPGGFGNIDFTGADGVYEIDNLTAGTYDVIAQRFGYEPLTVTVDVVDGATTIADLALTPLTFGSVSGTITDASTGDPVPNAFILINVPGGIGGGGTPGGFVFSIYFSISGADGTYDVPNVQAGDYEVTVFRPGYEGSAPLPITVVDGQNTTADVALTPLAFGTISGTVTDADTGLPLENARVRIAGSNFGLFTFTRFALTAADGTYTLDNVPTGDQDVTISRNGYETFGPVTATVVEATTTTVDAALTSLGNGNLTGTVTDSATGDPIENAFVITFQAAGGLFGGGIAFDRTDASGVYELNNIFTGMTQVLVFAPGYFRGTNTVDILDGQTTTADFVLDPR